MAVYCSELPLSLSLSFSLSQVEKSGADVHILACAPSNSAADQLCEKLLQHVDSYKVYRMYACSRDPELVPLGLLVSSCI